MSLARCWLLLPLGLAAALSAPAQSRPAGDGDGAWAYHREVRTAARQDPPPVAHAPAWGGWADRPDARWADSGPPADVVPASPDRLPGYERPRRDPNLRRSEVPGVAPAWGAVGDPWQDPRSRHGWRAGWRGAAPGWGGVWWSGWGGDRPAYAVGWDHAGPGIRDGRWHGTFGIEVGWGAGHGADGFGRGGGSGVIALPAPRGD